jgi:hypothetical protein
LDDTQSPDEPDSGYQGDVQININGHASEEAKGSDDVEETNGSDDVDLKKEFIVKKNSE